MWIYVNMWELCSHECTLQSQVIIASTNSYTSESYFPTLIRELKYQTCYESPERKISLDNTICARLIPRTV